MRLLHGRDARVTTSSRRIRRKPDATVMPNIDFFQFFRYTLGTVVTIYATILSLQSMYTWIIWLSGKDKYISMIRRYVIVHGLRLRFSSFWGDVLVCLLLCVVFIIIGVAHGRLHEMFNALHTAQAGR